MSDDSQGNYGWAGLGADQSEYHGIIFMIQQEMQKFRTNQLFKVVKVHDGGTDKGPPTVDVMPMINQVDGLGNMTPHEIVYGLATTRVQTGTMAIVNDAKVGDIMMGHIPDRDISALKGAAKDNPPSDPSNPGSTRQGNMSDMVLHPHAMLNPKAPTDYIHFMPDGGFHIKDKFGNDWISNSSGVTCNKVLIDRNGNISTPGNVTAGVGGGSVELLHHVHTEVVSGPDLTGPPEAGS